jgi:hypothetical protein
MKLTPPRQSETELHKSVARALDMLLLPPACFTCFPAGNVPLPPQFAAKLYLMGLKRGWPDFLVIHDGHVYGIELKAKGGALSKTKMVRTKRGTLKLVEGQSDVFPRLEAAGMRIAVCRSVDEVLAALQAWGVPLRRTS